MKRTTVLILIVLFISVSALAQSRVNAKDIIKSIDEGKDISYSGVVIAGDLDLTTLQDKEPDNKNRRSNKTFWYHVRVPLNFENCTFEDDVIAYYNDDRKNETHNAVFHESVSFNGCKFQGISAFKYSKFHKGADFSRTSYRKEALFKYAKFTAEISFAGSTFSNDANFKYTKFPEKANFSDVKFHDLANFKYTEFPEGVSFKDTVFAGDANFKYTKFYEPFDFDGAEFEDDVDFKYTKLEGKSFTTYLLKNRK